MYESPKIWCRSTSVTDLKTGVVVLVIIKKPKIFPKFQILNYDPLMDVAKLNSMNNQEKSLEIIIQFEQTEKVS